MPSPGNLFGLIDQNKLALLVRTVYRPQPSSDSSPRDGLICCPGKVSGEYVENRFISRSGRHCFTLILSVHDKYLLLAVNMQLLYTNRIKVD